MAKDTQAPETDSVVKAIRDTNLILERVIIELQTNRQAMLETPIPVIKGVPTEYLPIREIPMKVTP